MQHAVYNSWYMTIYKYTKYKIMQSMLSVDFPYVKRSETNRIEHILLGRLTELELKAIISASLKLQPPPPIPKF